ncbi:MAG: hypothetical protein RI909_2286 [Bacteroidota bacterium]
MKKLFLPVFLLMTQLVLAQSLLIAAKEKGKPYGYINETGQYVIQPSFDLAGPFYQNRAVVKKGKKFGVINSKGEYIVSPIYDDAIDYAPEGKVTVKSGSNWGVIDEQGKTIIPFQYAYLSVFKNGYVVGGRVLTGKAFKGRICPLVLNEKADTVFIQDDCEDMPDFLIGRMDKKGLFLGVWPIVRDGKVLLESGYELDPIILDIKGNQKVTLTSITIDNAYGFREGLLPATFAPEGPTRDGIYIDSAGLSYNSDYIKSFDTLRAQQVYPFFNGVAGIEQDGKWSFIDREGSIISKTNLPVSDYKAFPPMHFNGLVGFFKKGKVGYVNLEGEVVIPFQYDEYHPFEEAVTPVKYKGLYGLIRKDGSWAVQPKFEMLYLSPCPCYQ